MRAGGGGGVAGAGGGIREGGLGEGLSLRPGAVGSPGWGPLRREAQRGGLNVSVGGARRGRRGRAEASAARMGGRDS